MKARDAVVMFVIAMVAIPVSVFLMSSMGVLGQTKIIGGGDTGAEELSEALDEALNVHDYSEVTIDFDIKSTLTGGQDDQDDWDIDIFGPVSDDALDDLLSDAEVDCTGVIPVTIPEGATSVTLDKEDTKLGSRYMCLPNLYSFGQSWTIGDTESEMDDDVDVWESDVGDKSADDSPGGGTDSELDVGQTYLITVVDDSEDDHYPVVFLFTPPEKGVIEADQFSSQKFTIKVDAWKDAVAGSKLRFDGEASDDQDNDDYDIDDLTILSSDLTTAASSVKITGEWTIETTDSGVALLMNNPLADGSSEHGYYKVDPYIQNASGVHILGSDGDDFGTADDDFIFTLYMQGVEIVSDSTTDAYTDEAGDKIRATDGGVSSGLFKNLYGDDQSITISFKVDQINQADYDATDDPNDDILTGGEHMFDLYLYQPYSSTEIINNLKSSNTVDA